MMTASPHHKFLTLALSLCLSGPVAAADISPEVRAIEPRVVEWRRDIHAHPELGNREFRTAELVSNHLKSLGLEVETGVAHTGVIGLLKGSRPGPTVALRADMDALPVTEEVDLPFASRVTTEYQGKTVGVMHACGHDNHVAILMGAAQVLAEARDELAGNVLFIFQPAEEGAPEGEEGGAELMLKEGLFDRYQPDLAFAMHVSGGLEVGKVQYRSGPAMAAADGFKILIHGRQTHASRPWNGVDPIVVGSQIILGLQTIASRQVNVIKAPSIITVGIFDAGIRGNIIPDEAVLSGTIRTFDETMRQQIHHAVERMVVATAEAAGATAEFEIKPGSYPVTVNDPELTARMLPTLERVAGDGNLSVAELVTGAEDFSFFAQRVPGLYLRLGATPRGMDPATVASNHSPRFVVDEAALPLGVELMVSLTRDAMMQAHQ